MARPKGKQIAVTCAVCGTVRHWPPSKANGKKYCSRDCRDAGLSLVTEWSEIGTGSVIYRLPNGSDPNGRGIIRDGRSFLWTDDGWQELTIERLPVGDCWRIVDRESIDESEIPTP